MELLEGRVELCEHLSYEDLGEWEHILHLVLFFHLVADIYSNLFRGV
mgnify:CR=1 FL=1